MKKIFTLFVFLFSLLSFAGIVLAEEVTLNTPVEQVIVKPDKNGNVYVRVVFLDSKKLNGAMAFGNQVAAASRLKKGDTLNVIASKSTYRGGTSYQILKFLK